MDKERVKAILNGNKRFQAPYTDPEGYYIWNYDSDMNEIQVDDSMIELYFEKLKYAVENAESLIKSAVEKLAHVFERQFDISFQRLCSEVIFDSFVFVPSKNIICACLANEKLMFGHFIAVMWNLDFHVLEVEIG